VTGNVDILSAPADNETWVRIIKTSTLTAFWEKHSDAEASLRTWAEQTKAGAWQNFAELRRTFPSADSVTVTSGRTVVVFNIAQNRYRLITAAHYNTQIVYTLMVLTHKQYDRGAWTKQL
jgi:mRNA interferase HigB